MKRSILISLALSITITLAACAGGSASQPTITPLPEPSATPRPTVPPTTPPTESIFEGDPEIGEEIYTTPLDDPGRHSCSECHTLTGVNTYGPTFKGLSQSAGERVPGMSAEEYLRESIINPGAYRVEGFPAGLMPEGYGDMLSEEEINHLIAFMLTQ
jgi:mono/diheme cytochrome c family protein